MYNSHKRIKYFCTEGLERCCLKDSFRYSSERVFDSRSGQCSCSFMRAQSWCITSAFRERRRWRGTSALRTDLKQIAAIEGRVLLQNQEADKCLWVLPSLCDGLHQGDPLDLIHVQAQLLKPGTGKGWLLWSAPVWTQPLVSSDAFLCWEVIRSDKALVM